MQSRAIAPRRRPWLHAALAVSAATLLVKALAPLPARAADTSARPSVPELVAAARRAGLRVLEGDHLALATDRPIRSGKAPPGDDTTGDDIDALPRLFDEAFAAWCRHFRIDRAEHRQWRAFGCLVVDRERFRAAGLLPDTLPDFANGFCDRDRFWMMDQSNPAYRRHLLLHEGVHAFTLTLCSLATPPWYTEGIAELLATHRLDASSGGFAPTPIPLRAGDVEQLGRIEALRLLAAAGRPPGLEDVFATPAAGHHELQSYAASWAAVAMLSRHPAHAQTFAAAERGPLDASFTSRLTGSAGWNGPRAARDFAAFIDDVDYGYDFARSAVDWSPGSPLDSRRRIDIAADRGWQNTGCSLQAGRRYEFAATGRFTVGRLAATPPEQPTVLESEADGISLRWYRGRPLGRLLVAQWVERPDGGGPPRFVTLATGGRAGFTAAADGVAFARVNDPPGERADNAGGLLVEIAPE